MTAAADELLAIRLSNHHLSAPHLDDPASLVAHLGAVQAQDYPAAKWSLAQRLVSATDASIERAFAEGKILRTHVLRPTWHFVAPADIRWMLALTGPRIKAAVATSTRNHGLDAALILRGETVIASALRGGNFLTRPELGAALQQAGMPLDAASLQHVVFHAELDAVIISGPPCGKQQTYALLEQRVPPARPFSRDEALAELTWRYFNSHGPALVADCSWWSGLTMSDVKHGVSLNSHRLQCATVDGRAYWSGPCAAAVAENSVHLLPNYDEYTVAYRSRELYFNPRLNPTGNSREDVPFRDVVVARGKVAGRWERRTHAATWWINPLASLERDLRRAAQRYEAFRAAESRSAS
jgi:winged helix DNA-binding protein